MQQITVPDQCDDDCQFFVETCAKAICTLFKKELHTKAYYDPDYKKCQECLSMEGTSMQLMLTFDKPSI